MIEFEAVRKTYRDPSGKDITAVRDVSFSVNDGEIFCLIGPSGCGKTTTLKMVNRLIEPNSGTIRVGGEDIFSRDITSLRRGIGYVIQKGGLFPHLTVFENVGLLPRLEGWPKTEIHDRVQSLMRLVNLEPKQFSSRRPSELSGGQRQRVGVARALSLDPKYVLLDEPFGALDPITRSQMHEEFLTLRERVQKTMIIVTHDLAEAFKLGDRVGLMKEGALVQAGTRQDFQAAPANDFVRRFLNSHLEGPNL